MHSQYIELDYDTKFTHRDFESQYEQNDTKTNKSEFIRYFSLNENN